jgi:hypothetical protein
MKNEVRSHKAIAEEEIKKITSVGEEVKKSFSGNTVYLLSRKRVDTSKTKSMNMSQAEIISLRRLHKLSLGQLTIKAMQQLSS